MAVVNSFFKQWVYTDVTYLGAEVSVRSRNASMAKGSSAIGSRAPMLEDKFRLASAASNDCLWEWDLTTGEIRRSEAMATRFGYASAEVGTDSQWWRDRIHPADRDRASNSIDTAIAQAASGSWTCEYRFQRKDGTYAEVCDRGYVLKDEGGRATRVVGAVMDLSELKQAYRELHQSEERYRHTIGATGQVAWSASADGQFINFDDAWSSLTDLSRCMTLPEWERVSHPDDLEASLEQWQRCVETGEPLELEHRLKVRDGAYRWYRSRAAARKDANGKIENWYGIIEDIHELKVSQQALRRLAEFDDLTSLKNRHAFSADLEGALDDAGPKRRKIGLLVLDIDDFKTVNDLFGHDAGDTLLMSFARRMLDAGIELYRTGGDEFAAIVRKCPDKKTLLHEAERIHSALEQPFRVAGTVLDCRTSIGSAIFPNHGDSPSELLKSADIALYSAKTAGKRQTRHFESAMRSDLQRRNSMLEVARHALAEDLVGAFMQPKVCLRTGRVVGFEALMRVRNERFGPQGPSIIGAAFDHPELSLEIANRVLADITTVLRKWLAQGLHFGRIAINASPLEFRDGKYAERLLARLAMASVSPEHIEVEVTESVLLEQDESKILQSLHRLKEAGITIALDDFGTGYASLSHLQRYPVDVLKIDQSFVREITTHPRQELITKAIINLSRTIGIQTVAEGIETAEQADLLESLGCNIGQGFLFGRAVSMADAERLLETSNGKFRMQLASELQAG